MKKQIIIGATCLPASNFFLATAAHAIEFKLSGQVSLMIVAPNDDSRECYDDWPRDLTRPFNTLSKLPQGSAVPPEHHSNSKS